MWSHLLSLMVKKRRHFLINLNVENGINGKKAKCFLM